MLLSRCVLSWPVLYWRIIIHSNFLVSTQILRIGLYGDEANISENVFDPFKVLCIFMNVIHYRPANIRLSRYLIFNIRSDWIAGPQTLRPILRKMTESLNLAFDSPGLFDNRERFIVAEFRGDQEFHRKIWQHTAHWLGINVCCKCGAKSSGHCLYTDVRDDPDWANTEYDTVKFINEELPEVPCTLTVHMSCFFLHHVLPGTSNQRIELNFFGKFCATWNILWVSFKVRPLACTETLRHFLHQSVLHALCQSWTSIYSKWIKLVSWRVLFVLFGGFRWVSNI